MLCDEAKGFLPSVFQLTKRPIDWLVGKPGKRTRRLGRASNGCPVLMPSAGQRSKQCNKRGLRRSFWVKAALPGCSCNFQMGR